MHEDIHGLRIGACNQLTIRSAFEGWAPASKRLWCNADIFAWRAKVFDTWTLARVRDVHVTTEVLNHPSWPALSIALHIKLLYEIDSRD